MIEFEERLGLSLIGSESPSSMLNSVFNWQVTEDTMMLIESGNKIIPMFVCLCEVMLNEFSWCAQKRFQYRRFSNVSQCNIGKKEPNNENSIAICSHTLKTITVRCLVHGAVFNWCDCDHNWFSHQFQMKDRIR